MFRRTPHRWRPPAPSTPAGWLRAGAAIVTLVLAGALAGTVGATEAASRVLPWTGPTPALDLADLAGKPHTLADYRGRVVLVNFWATWCEPCLDEMPSIRKLQKQLAGEPFTVLAVNYGESAARIESFLPRVGVDFPVLLDRGQKVARAWRVRILPASFLVGPDGRLHYHVIGEIDWTSDEAVAAVRGLMERQGTGAGARR